MHVWSPVTPRVHVLAVRVGAGGGRQVQLGGESSSVFQWTGGPGPVLPGVLRGRSRGLWVIVRGGAVVAVVGERLGVQLQGNSYNAVLPEEGAAAMCRLATRFGAQRWISLACIRWWRVQRRLLSIKPRVVVVRGLRPVKGFTEWTPISTLLQSSWWRSFSLR